MGWLQTNQTGDFILNGQNNIPSLGFPLQWRKNGNGSHLLMPLANEIERNLMRSVIFLDLHPNLILFGSDYKALFTTHVNSALRLRATKPLHFASQSSYQSIRLLKCKITLQSQLFDFKTFSDEAIDKET